MKKLNYLWIALLTMLLIASCSENEVISNDSENEANVSFALQLPNDGPQTRALGDGKSIDQLVYTVYDEDGKEVPNLSGGNKDNFPQSINLSLLKGRKYKIAFWAQNSGCTAYGTNNLENVTVKYDGLNNDESRDAFFKTVEFTVGIDKTMDVELVRPFAQLNVGVTTTDWNKAIAAGFTVCNSKVTFENAATSINLLDGTVSGDTMATLGLDSIPTETLVVGGETYQYLSMSYLLVNDKDGEKAMLENLKLEFQDKGGKSIELTQGLTNVPVQRNYRTNILGRLLTGDIQFDITIDERFKEPVSVNKVIISFFDINDNVTSSGKQPSIGSMLGYYTHVNVGGPVNETESFVVKYFDSNDNQLGSLSLNESGYSNFGAGTGLGGTINLFGDYKSSSWDAEYFGSWKKGTEDYNISVKPTKVVAIVKYKNGEFSEATQVEFLKSGIAGHHTNMEAFDELKLIQSHAIGTLQLYVNEGLGWSYYFATSNDLTMGDIAELSLKLSDENGNHLVTRKLKSGANVSDKSRSVNATIPYIGSSWDIEYGDIADEEALKALVFVNPNSETKVVKEIPSGYTLEATVKYKKNGIVVTKNTNRFRTINTKAYWEDTNKKTIIIVLPENVKIEAVEETKPWNAVKFETVGDKAKISLVNEVPFGSVQYKVILDKEGVKYTITIAPTQHIKNQSEDAKILFMEVK